MKNFIVLLHACIAVCFGQNNNYLDMNILREPTELKRIMTIMDSTLKEINNPTFSEFLVGIGEQIGVLESNRDKVDQLFSHKEVQEILKSCGSTFLWNYGTREINGSTYRTLYYIKSVPELHVVVKSAWASTAPTSIYRSIPIIKVKLSDKDTKRFARVTSSNTNKYLAIVIDNRVLSAPIIHGGKYSSLQIEGDFTIEEANNISRWLSY